ncbi:single-stranded DNA-binding protein [Amorphus sp. 3PC139-8]|uniref:single-stranded DNA-binding protein n=1 Tax=Amorphus sp. 3PC139-8 TaxID=2735676 RepID=UPI00345CE3DD
MLNKVQLIGRLGADPDVRELSTGRLVANMRVATTARWKSKGERHERTEWHTVRVFGDPLVKMVRQLFKKGQLVFLEGSLSTRRNEKDGVVRYFTDVVVGQHSGGMVRLLSTPSDGSGEGDTGAGDMEMSPDELATLADLDELPALESEEVV